MASDHWHWFVFGVDEMDNLNLIGVPIETWAPWPGKIEGGLVAMGVPGFGF